MDGNTITSEGKFLRQQRGIGRVARIEIEIKTGVPDNFTLIECKGEGGGSHGDIEEVSERGYISWKTGAIAGINYALTKCAAPSCQIRITRIRGMTTDTDPTVVAVAAIDAIWKAFSFQPSPELSNYLEELAYKSSKLHHDAIPTFLDAPK